MSAVLGTEYQKVQILWNFPKKGVTGIVDLVEGSYQEREQQIKNLIAHYQKSGCEWEGDPVKREIILQ